MEDYSETEKINNDIWKSFGKWLSRLGTYLGDVQLYPVGHVVLDREIRVVRIWTTFIFSLFVANSVVFHLFVEKDLIGDMVVILIDEGQMGDDISVVNYSQRFRDVFLNVVCQFDISDPWGSVGV